MRREKSNPSAQLRTGVRRALPQPARLRSTFHISRLPVRLRRVRNYANTDHAPHSKEEKEAEFMKAPMGIIGLETALGLVLSSLVGPGILMQPQAICKMTKNPAGILNLERGELKIGPGLPDHL